MTEFIHAPVASKEIGVFSKRDPIFRRKMWIWSHLLKKSFIFCAVLLISFYLWFSLLRKKILIELHESHPGIVNSILERKP